MQILCRVPLVARNWARRKAETIMYIEMSLPPGKRRVIESTVYHLYQVYIHIVTFSLVMSPDRTLLSKPLSRNRSCSNRPCPKPVLALDIPVKLF